MRGPFGLGLIEGAQRPDISEPEKRQTFGCFVGAGGELGEGAGLLLKHLGGWGLGEGGGGAVKKAEHG